MRRFVTTLFDADETVPEWGSRYTWQWVAQLARGIGRHQTEPCMFACLHDDPTDPHGYRFTLPARGWAKLLECFRPDVVGDRALVVDLDTVVVGDLGKLLDIDAELVCPRDPYEPDKLTSYCFAIDGKLAAEVWERWRDTWQDEIESGRYAVRGMPFCDQEWMRKNLGDRVTFLDDVMPGAVLSYKRDVQGKLTEKPEGCLAVAYHGLPKQDEELPEAWAREGWA